MAPADANRRNVPAMEAQLRYTGLNHEQQRNALTGIVRAEPLLMRVLKTLRDERLPQGLLVAGAIYNAVWNVLSDRPALRDVNDIDVVYFDDSDLSYEAEDRVIRHFAALFADLPLPVQVRNQARVHLWFPHKFGQPLAPLTSADAMLPLYATRAQAVACRLGDDDRLEVIAPFGLDDLFAFRVVPNRALAGNAASHTKKAQRAKAIWPQVVIEPW